MREKTTGRKIWEVIYPFLALLVLYFGVVYGGLLLFSSSAFAQGGSLDEQMGKNFALISSVALVVIIVVEGIFYKNDAYRPSRVLYKKPVYFFWIVLLGAAASHGLNLVFSLLNTTGIFQGYQAVENEIYAPGVVWVIIRTLLLAPVAEELVFRGLIFRRMKAFTGFWPAALVSAALFGLYHMNLPQGLFAFLFGLLLARVHHRFDNLLAPVALHFSANLLSVILTYTGAKYPNPTVLWISMICMFAITALILVFVVRKIPAPSSDEAH